MLFYYYLITLGMSNTFIGAVEGIVNFTTGIVRIFSDIQWLQLVSIIFKIRGGKACICDGRDCFEEIRQTYVKI